MKTTKLLSEKYLATYPEEAAKVLEKCERGEVSDFLGKQPPRVTAQILQVILPALAADFLQRVEDHAAGETLREMSPQDAARLLIHLTETDRSRMLSLLPPEVDQPIERLLQYPAGSAGAHMNPCAVFMVEDMSVAQAMQHARKQNPSSFFFPYVVDRGQRLVGVVTTRGLMLAGEEQKLCEIVQREIVSIPAAATGSEIRRMANWRSYPSLPVVDQNGILIGAISQDSLRDLVRSSKANNPEEDLKEGLWAFGELYVQAISALMPLAAETVAGILQLNQKEEKREH